MLPSVPAERFVALDVQNRKADVFERFRMSSLFPSGEQGGERETSKTLPEEVCQLIVDLHAEAPSMSAARNR